VEQAAQYKQQAAWLEQEAKEQERWANHLVWVVANKEWAQAPGVAQAEEQDCRKEAKCQQVHQWVAAAVEEEEVSRPTTVLWAAGSDNNVFVVEVTDPKDDLR